MTDILGKGLHDVRFRRTLHGESLELSDHIKQARGAVILSDQKDVVKWPLTSNGKYTVKSCYRFMIQTGDRYPHKFLLKVKMPPHVKVFMWLTLRGEHPH